MEYTITNVQKRDEWEFQGSQMQDYAITLEGQTDKGWVKLTQKVETQPPKVGDVLNGRIEKKETRNGKEYWKFKKVNPNFSGGSPGGRGFDGGISKEDAEYIILMLEELTLRREAPDNPQPRSAGNTKPVEDKTYDNPFEGLL